MHFWWEYKGCVKFQTKFHMIISTTLDLDGCENVWTGLMLLNTKLFVDVIFVFRRSSYITFGSFGAGVKFLMCTLCIIQSDATESDFCGVQIIF